MRDRDKDGVWEMQNKIEQKGERDEWDTVPSPNKRKCSALEATGSMWLLSKLCYDNEIEQK
ncbi:unnamed protein product [Prunus armeniaca]